MTGYAAHLRVYEPLAAFVGADRAHWQAYAATAPRQPGAVLALERQAALRALTGPSPVVVPELAEQAHVLEVDGVTLICPLATRVRAWEGLGEFAAELPQELADAFVPRAVVERAGSELERWRVEHPTARTAVLSCTWQVPLRWFVLVDGDERVVSEGAPAPLADHGLAERGHGAPPGRRTGRSLVYRTAMSRARRRVARALAVLRRSTDAGLVAGGVEDLGRWLEEFHPRSLVELDYGGLVHLMDDTTLREDESARDVNLGLAALGRGDEARASAAYGRVAERMKVLQAVESAN